MRSAKIIHIGIHPYTIQQIPHHALHTHYLYKTLHAGHQAAVWLHQRQCTPVRIPQAILPCAVRHARCAPRHPWHLLEVNAMPLQSDPGIHKSIWIVLLFPCLPTCQTRPSTATSHIFHSSTLPAPSLYVHGLQKCALPPPCFAGNCFLSRHSFVVYKCAVLHVVHSLSTNVPYIICSLSTNVPCCSFIVYEYAVSWTGTLAWTGLASGISSKYTAVGLMILASLSTAASDVVVDSIVVERARGEEQVC